MVSTIYALQVPIDCGVQEVFFQFRDLAVNYAEFRNLPVDIIEYDLYDSETQFDFVDSALDFDFDDDFEEWLKNKNFVPLPEYVELLPIVQKDLLEE